MDNGRIAIRGAYTNRHLHYLMADKVPIIQKDGTWHMAEKFQYPRMPGACDAVHMSHGRRRYDVSRHRLMRME